MLSTREAATSETEATGVSTSIQFNASVSFSDISDVAKHPAPNLTKLRRRPTILKEESIPNKDDSDMQRQTHPPIAWNGVWGDLGTMSIPESEDDQTQERKASLVRRMTWFSLPTV